MYETLSFLCFEFFLFNELVYSESYHKSYEIGYEIVYIHIAALKYILIPLDKERREYSYKEHVFVFQLWKITFDDYRQGSEYKYVAEE